MGLAQNIPAVEARQTMTMARAIGVAFGSPELVEQVVFQATGNAQIAFRARVRATHEKAAQG